MESFFLHYLTAWEPLALLAVFFAVIIEGDMALFAAAYLVNQGFFGATEIMIVVPTAVFSGDWMWYGIGRWGRLPAARLSRWACRLAGPIDGQLAKRPGRAIFISKFAYGLNHITLMRAGAMKIAPKVFLLGDTPAGVMWMLIIGGLGYGFGASAALLKGYIHYSEMGLLAGLLVIFGLRKVIQRKIEKEP